MNDGTLIDAILVAIIADISTATLWFYAKRMLRGSRFRPRTRRFRSILDKEEERRHV
ncbi:hypothetical protein [Nonomuraea cavernae]|uniref:hypothetical protein n=1 Tax=Nonomuraea cavernae TaxID=2045107 RepID=UPI00166B6FEB|nr:hypothetical protein [Nonomuraea cavernae]MCA2185951.1 hypothetical protein [Nonomuraea cavernae]